MLKMKAFITVRKNLLCTPEKKKFRYFLEVFNPNVDPGIKPKTVGGFLNDSIIRGLAGVTSDRPPRYGGDIFRQFGWPRTAANEIAFGGFVRVFLEKGA